MEFNETIMGKIAKGAVLSWGDKDSNGQWYQPTPEQADMIVLQKYPTAEIASSTLTWGSEFAAIEGLVSLIEKIEGEMNPEERTALVEEMKRQCFSQSELNPDIAERVRNAMGAVGVEQGIIDILRGIHDNWVRDNGNKFDDPKRAKKLHQFVDLRLMTFDGDGALADLIFLQPILEGAGVEVDKEGKLRAKFEELQEQYKNEMDITDCDGLRRYLSNLDKTYPPVDGLKTNKGTTLETPVLVIDEIRNNTEIFERMTRQVSDKCNISYTDPKKTLEQKKAELKALAEEIRALEEQAQGRKAPSQSQEETPGE
jgi:polyhydroxyalkanoate synthesis regulator phasin